jgi:hypothetical protein
MRSLEEPKRFVLPDHPVRSIKGGFAASFLMSRPPLLYQEGSCQPLIPFGNTPFSPAIILLIPNTDRNRHRLFCGHLRRGRKL